MILIKKKLNTISFNWSFIFNSYYFSSFYIFFFIKFFYNFYFLMILNKLINHLQIYFVNYQKYKLDCVRFYIRKIVYFMKDELIFLKYFELIYFELFQCDLLNILYKKLYLNLNMLNLFLD